MKRLSIACAASFVALAATASWTYSSGTLSDENWSLKASISSGKVTVSGVNSGAGALDLSQPCSGGSIVAVGAGAFSNCLALTSLVFPDTDFTIGINAFRDCTNLKGKLTLGTVGRVTFLFNGGNRDSYAFANTGIEELEVGLIGTNLNSTPTLMSGTFMNCTSLTKLTFLANCDLTTTKTYCFKGCTSLRTVSPLLPTTIKTVGASTFEDCPVEGKLTLGSESNVTFEFTGGGGRLSYAFAGTKITEVEFGEAQTSLDTCVGLFKNCTELEKIAFLSPSLTTVYTGKPNVIDNCPKLHEIAFSDSKPTIGTGWIANAEDKKIRFTYPKTSTAWASYISELGTDFTAWNDDAGDGSAESVYKETFSDWSSMKPAGYTKKMVTAYNIWLVPVRSGEAGDINLNVTGSPVSLGAVSPGYTAQEFPKVEAGTVCTAPQYAEDGDCAWKCAGYLLEKQNDDASWSTVEERSDALSYTVGDDAGSYRLTWKWEKAAYAVKVEEIDASFGTVAITGTPFEGGDEISGKYYAQGSTVNVTVMPAAGRQFLRWYGPVASGAETELSVDVTVSGVVGLSPYFATPWTYDDTAKTLSDGYWTFTTSGSVSGLTLTAVTKHSIACTLLDLRKATEGAAVTSISASLFKGDAQLTEVRLPDTLTSIGNSAFASCLSLKTVTPLLPDTVTYVATDAFYQDPIEGRLQLGQSVAFEFGQDGTGVHMSRAFGGTRITDLSLGTVKNGVVYANAFENCTCLTNVVFENDTVASINASAFDGCTALKKVTPFLSDAVGYLGPYAFRNCPLEGKLVLGMKGNLAFDCATGGQRPAYTFQGASITELTLGPGVTNSWFQGLFQNCTELTSVRISGYAHTYKTYSNTFCSDIFTGVPTTARFYLDRASAEWNAWLADESNATAWADLTDEDRQAYYDAHGLSGKRPVARAKAGNKPFPSGAWLLRYTPGSGFAVSIR